MKHPLFAPLGNEYPKHLEAKFDRILCKMEELWTTPLIHDYFSELLIDKRGGRQGFPAEVLQDIVILREFLDFETFRAAERKEEAIAQLAARGIPLNNDGFLTAFRAGDQELVDLFVRAQFVLPVADQGEPLLLAAMKRGHAIVAKIVLGAGADIDVRNRIGLTPLLMACGKTTQGYRVIAEGLIARGANVNVRDPLGNTPLLLALSGGMFDIAELLIAHGANLNVTSPKGESPLELAKKANTPASMKVLELMMGRLAKA